MPTISPIRRGGRRAACRAPHPLDLGLAATLAFALAGCEAGAGEPTPPDGGVDALPGLDAGRDAGPPVVAPQAGWPASSVCRRVDHACEGVEADGWPGQGRRFEWRAGGGGHTRSTLVAIDPSGEQTLATFETDTWHLVSGLAALPDGDVAIAGATLGPGALHVGETPVELPFPYTRFVLRIAPAGGVRWGTTFEGRSSEELVLAGRHDGHVVVAGELFDGVTVGAVSVPRPPWNGGVLVGVLDAAGDWAWAHALPQGPAIGTFALESLELGPHAEALLHGTRAGTVVIADRAHRCAPGARCPSTAVYAPDGTPLALHDRDAPRP